ncbi:serine/threonine protein phosphatase 1 [Chitinophaga sp. CF118]|uniref:metallophosphoesterase family protein n=1 Tax=Chitinophaga sp. CF118 TaxID=1884367 RepID=UPI0008EAB580|nr:metallophosphoesterase family protein [Chitinophaga sp. CF118]SFE63828.1 serine/threonine protein phosphatase 1 [Chitinophaga sp. CF118]
MRNFQHITMLDIMAKRTFVIGDIHGALRALKQLLLKIDLREDDKIIFLGDYVDGWSESAQVIEYLIESDTIYNCIFIKGNHDISCESWLNETILDPNWKLKSGKLTIQSYESFSSERKAAHLDFFSRMKYYHVDEYNRLFVHGGFTASNGPQSEQSKNNLTTDRTLWEIAIMMDSRIKKHSVLYPKKLLLFNEICIGHTPTLTYNSDLPMCACNVWNIDTGAGFTGRLSALNIDTKEILQSDKVLFLYPHENGRN